MQVKGHGIESHLGPRNILLAQTVAFKSNFLVSSEFTCAIVFICVIKQTFLIFLEFATEVLLLCFQVVRPCVHPSKSCLRNYSRMHTGNSLKSGGSIDYDMTMS